MACKIIYKDQSFDKDEVIQNLEKLFISSKKGYEKKSQATATKTTPAEGQAAATQSTQSQAPQITDEQRTEATRFANELKTEGIIPDTYSEMITDQDATPFWQFVAQQAQNVDENWMPLEGATNRSEQATIDAFGETVVDYAKELFPIDKLNSTSNVAKELEEAGNWDISDLRNEENQSSFLKEAIQRVKEGKQSRTNESVEIHINDNGSIGIDNGNHRIAEALINGENDIKVTVVNAKKVSESYRKAKIDGTNPELVKVVESLLSRSKTKQNENEISQEASAQEGGEEINAEETGSNEEADVLTEPGAQPVAEAPLTEQKTISQQGKEIADKIRSLKTKRDIAQANIFGIGIGIYDGAIETVATAVEQGAALVDAIGRGIQYIRDKDGDQLDEENFRKHIEDQASGRKPKIKVQVGEEADEKEKPRPKKERKEAQPEDVESGIEDYKMTTSGEVNRFLSGATWADVFGEAPEGNQQYETQRLSDMLQDGQNMIAIAQRKWGGDVMMYAKPLFQFIQGLSDAESNNKKAVLLAVLLGELQEAKLRSPERFEAIQQLERAVFGYYQNFMNQRGKEIVAARLLRLYRDKYLGDIYTDKILDEDQVRAKKKMQAVEQNKNIDDAIAAEVIPPVTKEEKKIEDAAAKKKTDTAKKDRSKKTRMSTTEAQQKADNKLKDIEDRMGKEGKSGLIDKIKEAIKKLNCK